MQCVTYQKFITVLTKIQACLSFQSLNDLDEYSVLTPAHYLTGDTITAIPDSSDMDVPENKIQWYQRPQNFLKHFWKRWSSEYLPLRTAETFKVENKCRSRNNRQNLPACKWILERVLERQKGAAGITRVVTIKTLGEILHISSCHKTITTSAVSSMAWNVTKRAVNITARVLRKKLISKGV